MHVCVCVCVCGVQHVTVKCTVHTRRKKSVGQSKIQFSFSNQLVSIMQINTNAIKLNLLIFSRSEEWQFESVGFSVFLPGICWQCVCVVEFSAPFLLILKSCNSTRVCLVVEKNFRQPYILLGSWNGIGVYCEVHYTYVDAFLDIVHFQFTNRSFSPCFPLSSFPLPPLLPSQLFASDSFHFDEMR